MAFIYYFKAFLCIVWFFICSFLTLILCLLRWRNTDNGLFFTRLFTWGCRQIMGIHIKIHNPERLLQYQPCIYVGNHQSNYDIFVQAHCYSPNTVVIGKQELIFIPIFGVIFYLAGNILLDRKDRTQALKSFEKVKNYLLAKKLSVYLFPEGTRNHGAKDLLPFKKGAFHLAIGAQVPLIPVVASPIYTLINPREKFMKKGTIHIHVLEPIYTTGKTENDVDQILDQTRIKMQEKFNQLVSEVR